MSKFDIFIGGKLDCYGSSSDYNRVTGPFWITHGDACFPCEGWDDYMFPQLEVWTTESIEYSQRPEEWYSMCFFDGPMRMDAVIHSDMQVEIRCVNERGESETIEHTILCSFEDFFRALYDAQERLDELLLENNMTEGAYRDIYEQNRKTLNVMDDFWEEYKTEHNME